MACVLLRVPPLGGFLLREFASEWVETFDSKVAVVISRSERQGNGTSEGVDLKKAVARACERPTGRESARARESIAEATRRATDEAGEV